jgi:hypothetical protein
VHQKEGGFIDADISATQGSSEGIYVTQISLRNAGFSDQYISRFGQPDISGTNLGYAALAYDAITLVDALAEKIAKTGAQVSSESMMKHLPNFSFDGVLGATSFSSNNSVARREQILQVKDGHFVEVEK